MLRTPQILPATIVAAFLLALAAPPLDAQIPDNAILSGNFHFVHLLVDAGDGQTPLQTSTLAGNIVFDGAGGFTYAANRAQGAAPPAGSSGAGLYSVAPDASVTLTNPILGSVEINGRVGAGADVLIGSSTEAGPAYHDVFVAIRAASGDGGVAQLNGNYSGASLAFVTGPPVGVRSAMVRFSGNGAGAVSGISVTGHGSDLGDVTARDEIPAVGFALDGLGAGSVNFVFSSELLFGSHELFVSGDGKYVLASSFETDRRSIVFAVRDHDEPADVSSWQGNFWLAELSLDSALQSASNGVGALLANGAGTVSISQRLHVGSESINFSGLNSYTLAGDGAGFLGPQIEAGATNFAIGASSSPPGAFVQAQVGAVGRFGVTHGLAFGIRMPAITGEGTFVSPLGVLNAASSAPPTFPISGGTLVSLYGSALAPSVSGSTTTPLATTLDGVTVTVDGIPAPLFFVSPAQINLQAPFAITGPTAKIIVDNNGVASNEVTVAVAPSSPGVFSVNRNGQGPGIITHADYSLVSAENPAAPGETVIVFLTGLGAVEPAFQDGSVAPSGPLSRTIDPDISVLFGNAPGKIFYSGAAPGFVGLYQINVTIPESAVTGHSVPVAILTGSALSDFVDIAIAR